MNKRIGHLALAAAALLATIGGPAMAASTTATPAAAAPAEAGMEAFFRGTLEITLPAFSTYRLTRQFFADHTFVDAEGPMVSMGAWTVENGKICTQRLGADKYCNLGVGKTVGATWEDKDPYTGNEVDFALTAERTPLR
jgi:hypothetical protein